MSDAFEERCAALAKRLQTLPDKPEETAAATLRALWHLAAGNALSVEAAQERALPTLAADGERRLEELIAQRVSGIPLAHLTGRQRFMGLELLAGKEALIPRRETELLGRAALAVLQRLAATRERVTVVDVCTGSGNLALALAQHEPKAQVFASDLSEEAVALARRNAEHVGLSSRVELRAGDLLAPFDEPRFHGAVDLLVCNPPYISSQKVPAMASEISEHEPRLAFDGGPLGVRILQRLLREAPRFLASGGWLAFEVGHGQGPAVLKRLQAQGDFAATQTVADAQGEIRAILASRAAP
ncbi:MAG TPA: peptide chain release factor N(5)-glutamine methyltransferase [Albitalea sp.]|nr:peptide chain release factor N(5)-glutamine methyltransferase [Albitalea sp.]